MSNRSSERKNFWGEKVVDVYSDSGEKTGEIVKKEGFFGEKTEYRKSRPTYSSSSTDNSSGDDSLLLNEFTLPCLGIGAITGAINGWVWVSSEMMNIVKLLAAIVGLVIGAIGGILVAAVLPWALILFVIYLIGSFIVSYLIPWLFS